MRLSARVLRAVSDQNNYEYSDEFEHNEGSVNTLYIQLLNAEHNVDGDPLGIPYHPATGSTLQMVLPSIDSNKVATKTGSQPFSDNSSIWSAAILDTDNFGGGNLVITLTEGGVAKRITIVNGVIVNPIDPSQC